MRKAGNLAISNFAVCLTGIVPIEAGGRSLQSLFRLMSENKTTPLDGAWLADPAATPEEAILQRADGEEFVVRKSTAPLHDYDGDSFGFVTVLHDITMLRALSSQLKFLARHDALTGLINRYEFDRQA